MTKLPLLGGYAAKQCPRRVHNDNDSTVQKVEYVVPDELQARFDAGIAFEGEVFAAFEEALGDACVRVPDGGSTRDRVGATMVALGRGVTVVLGGQLPHDVEGGRVGKPDVLVRWGSGYLPADVKHHRVTKLVRSKSVRISRLAEPAEVLEFQGIAPELSTRYDDYVQLAHYTRMLQAAGVHPGDDVLTGAIIGSDDLASVDPSGHALVWLALDQPLFETFSRSQGRRKRSALERYDHEHAFRLKVAQVARAQTGSADDPTPLVVPVWQPECTSCPWAAVCRNQIGEDAAAPAFKTGQLDVREWLALRDVGLETLGSLAVFDTFEPNFLDAYLPHVTHQRKPTERLESAVERARLLCDGITIKRTTSGPLLVPGADVEIAFDIEWDASQRVYLWGFRVATTGAHYYKAFTRWTVLDEASERELADEMVWWLRQQMQSASDEGQSVRVFHYTPAETTHLKRVLGAENISDILGATYDLFPLLRDNFFGARGLGIKQVAPAFGFHWRDTDPGGLQSQGWVVAAFKPEDSDDREHARRRLLTYNEDDVTATAVIRAGLRDLEREGLDRI